MPYIAPPFRLQLLLIVIATSIWCLIGSGFLWFSVPQKNIVLPQHLHDPFAITTSDLKKLVQKRLSSIVKLSRPDQAVLWQLTIDNQLYTIDLLPETPLPMTLPNPTVHVYFQEEQQEKILFQLKRNDKSIDTVALPMQNIDETSPFDQYNWSYGGPDVFLKWAAQENAYKITAKGQQRDTGHTFTLKKGRGIVWKEGRLREVIVGPQSKNSPLLTIAKEGHGILLSSWHTAGYKTGSQQLIPQHQNNDAIAVAPWQFIGVRSDTKIILAYKDQTISAEKDAWFIYRNAKWEQLSSPQTLTDFVEERIKAPLFVIEKIEEIRGKWHAKFIQINQERTQLHTGTLTLISSEQHSPDSTVEVEKAPKEHYLFPTL